MNVGTYYWIYVTTTNRQLQYLCSMFLCIYMQQQSAEQDLNRDFTNLYLPYERTAGTEPMAAQTHTSSQKCTSTKQHNNAIVLKA